MASNTLPRDKEVQALRDEIVGALNSSAHFDRTARIYASVERLSTLAEDPVVDYAVEVEPTRRVRALGCLRQASAELIEAVDLLKDEPANDDLDELDRMKATLGSLVNDWDLERGRWSR